MSGARQAPAVLVLTGGLVHLVHQLAVVSELPELAAAPADRVAPDRVAAVPPAIGVLITGVLRRDPVALAGLHGAFDNWFALLRQRDPQTFGGLHLLPDEAAAAAGDWSIVCLNNQWVEGQRSVIERLDLRDWVVCGDGLGIYYRCARELRALLPSLLNRPIPEPGRRVRYVLSGRQPLWHRPPAPAQPPPERRRLELFETLVASQEREAAAAVRLCLAAAEDAPPGRPLWLCSVPNLAHQFPGGRIPMAVLQPWRRQLERRHGFDPACDRLVLIDHPKAPPQGSFGPRDEPWLAGPLRTPVALEVLVELLIRSPGGRPVVVAGLTSALYGVRRLTGAAVVWLGLAPLWRANPLYRRKPLEFLHRCLRVARMAWITGSG